LSFALGGNGRSRAAAHCATYYFARTSTDALPNSGSGNTTDRAADRRLCGTVCRRRVRQQQAAADTDYDQYRILHLE
jgi:hypothetical protein